MTVLLILFTFAIFLLIDHFYGKRQVVLAQAADTKRESLPRPRPSIVAGFQIPENLRFHPGHTWALSESPSLVRMGIDDFASKLLGKVERITLPQRGQWVRQGQKIMTIFRDGKSVDMVSPIEGSVADVNDAALANPEAARKDPYGEGWLLTVHSPDAKTNFRNLFGGTLARSWMADAAQRLQLRIPTVAGALAQDGGLAVDDLTEHLPDQDWAAITKEFFLS